MTKRRDETDKPKVNRQSVDISGMVEEIKNAQDSKEWTELSMAQKCRVLIQYGIEYLKGRSND